MAKGQQQLDQVPQDAHFVTVQAGGNDAGFYSMARDCIFHNERGIAYDGQYPDPMGKCATSIATFRRFLDADRDKPGIWKFMDDTIRDIIAHRSTSRRNFKLYVLGYAHLFSTEAPGSDWSTHNDQRLDHKRFNDQIQDVIKNLNNKKVKYISTTEGFNGHRFCGKGHNLYDQYFGSNVWLWNASPAGLVSAEADQTKANDEWSAVYNRTFVFTPGADAFDWSDLLQVKKGPEAKSPHQGWSPGIALRPLRPKLEGHRSIKDSLVPYVI
ncbi:hypothetical protein Slin15195_G001950 [Septoria linicola]|uniref:SGNH hydrolase-type esterase domain-containing protein n=1 Tax=Septoria linicola TaxID=215465 RepID=A0A9Q9ECN1_9PEZI|nr:hypothetical protein Slin14017_G001980 [Septoria linicola]USW46876.1 hypothetical protein Slin15195_G001950 [Septoria linicola]